MNTGDNSMSQLSGGVIMKILKKGNTNDCNNWRGVDIILDAQQDLYCLAQTTP